MTTRKEILQGYRNTVEEIKEAGLFKGELPYVSPQGAYVISNAASWKWPTA